MAAKLKHGIWVVVADGEKALFLENKGDGLYPDFVVVQEFAEENPPAREQGSDRPGRFNDGPSPHRSAVADTDWRLQGDHSNRAAGGSRRDAQEAAQGGNGHGRRGIPEDADQPSGAGDREDAHGGVRTSRSANAHLF